jgi:phosphonate transport system substrate-binding protein
MRGIAAGLACLAVGAALAPLAHAADDALVMGVFPRRNAAETTKIFTPMAEHLSAQLGRQVRLVTSRDFESFWHGVTARRYDIVHYKQYH